MTDTVGNNASKKVIIKNCTPFTDCISGISNTQLDNAKDIFVAMPMFSLIEYSDKNSNTSPSLWQSYRDKPAVNDDSIIADFSDNSASFKFKEKITGQTGNDDTKDLEIAAATPINWKPTFSITHRKLYVLVVTLSTYDSIKLLQKLKSGFKPTINWNKYQSRRTIQAWNQYFD